MLYKIELSKGMSTILTKEDYLKYKDYNWIFTINKKDKKGYAVGTTGKYRFKKLHRLIIEAKDGEIVDHINRDTLDNRKENLRIVSASLSNINKDFSNKLGTRGVTKVNKGGFMARLTYNGKRLYLGHFKTLEEAKKAFDESYSRYYGK